MSTCNIVPICFTCARLKGVKPKVGFVCDAFPNAIPVDILASAKDHRKPYDGDNGLQYVAKEEVEKEALDMAIATDPPVSEKQRRAMWAAKSGHSTLGIPQSVGKEFAEADPGGKLPDKARDMSGGDWKGLIRGLLKFFHEESQEQEHQDKPLNKSLDSRAAGIAFQTKDGKLLFLKRTGTSDYKDHWAFPGGSVENNETPEQCARRESREEIGDVCDPESLNEFDHNDGFTTYHNIVDEFEPELNEEHSEYKWCPIHEAPEPLHPGVRKTLDKLGPGELSETTRKDIGSPGSEYREEMPTSAFLGPEKTYPVKEERDGDWQYTEKLLLAAARRARMQGRGDIARRADAIREREFSNNKQGEDEDFESYYTEKEFPVAKKADKTIDVQGEDEEFETRYETREFPVAKKVDKTIKIQGEDARDMWTGKSKPLHTQNFRREAANGEGNTGGANAKVIKDTLGNKLDSPHAAYPESKDYPVGKDIDFEQSKRPKKRGMLTETHGKKSEHSAYDWLPGQLQEAELRASRATQNNRPIAYDSCFGEGLPIAE